MTLDLFLGVVGVALAFAVLLPFVQGARRKATLDVVEKELQIEREARLAQEHRCNEQIAELRGQVKVLNERIGQAIAREVITALRKEGVIP